MMIRSLTTSRPVIVQHDHVARYLEALAALCLEVSRRPKLLPVFLKIVALVPRTVEELHRQRLAA